MKSKLLVLSLFTATSAGIAFAAIQAPPPMTAQAPLSVALTPVKTPSQNSAAAVVEVVFVLDTTGSMGGLLQAAKEKIWSIASTLASAEEQPEVRVGLVAFRDRQDAYVTKTVDLSSDLDSVYATLMDFQAGGGGDGPESVNQALHEAVRDISWSQGQGTYRSVFLVGDAPPHMDYQDDVKYPATVQLASSKGIVINTLQVGKNQAATGHWQRIAQLGAGAYAQVGQAGNAVVIATPFDKKMATLSRKLDDTRMFYGDRKTRDKMQAKEKATQKLHAGASVSSRARRATFNTTDGGRKNLLGDSDLVEDIAKGRVKLDDVEHEHLPSELKNLDEAQQRLAIHEIKRERDSLESEIKSLAKKRGNYLRKQVKEDGGAKDSMDQKLYEAVRAQASSSGMRYSAPTPSY